ncbi:hypothetical protein PENSPDRAFT_683594 [Peniophora sp. CONT]|nr:hypothetical protein PENSPDRAFT_683594 [Peniophora sp. CONT]
MALRVRRSVPITPSLKRRCPRRAVVMNLDALSTIQSFLDRQTLLACMLACRDLYLSGVRFLLRFDTSLTTDAHVESFAAFVARDRRTRLHLLRHFSLDFRDKTSASVPLAKELLLDVLKYSPLLERLVIEGFTSSLGDDTTVVRLITHLRHLKELHILVSRDTAPALLSDLSAPVAKLDIHVLDDLGEPWEAMPMVTRFTRSLEELCLSALVTLTSLPNRAVFPRMHRLSLNGAYFRHVSPLLYAFPNLNELYVAYAHLHSHEIEETRATNIAAQAVRRWEKLDDLSGVLRALYVAAIEADVHKMSIQLVDCLETDIARLHAVLDTTCPRVLNLDFLLRLVRELPHMVPIDAGKNLKALRLCISMAACTPDMCAESILDGIYGLLAPFSSLTHLTVRLFCPDWSTDSREAYRDRVAAFRGMEINSIAERIVEEVPSLKHLMLDICPGATLVQENGPQLSSGRAAEYWECRDEHVALGEWAAGERIMADIGL